MEIQRGAALIGHIWKNFKVNKSVVLELSFTKKKISHTGEHFKENNILNIYQLNIFNNLFFYIESKTEKCLMLFSLISYGFRIITQPVSLKIIILHLPSSQQKASTQKQYML